MDGTGNVTNNPTPTETQPPTTPKEPITTTPQQKPPEEGAKDGVQKAVEKAARKLKIKVDGVEEELLEEEVVKLAQLSKASQKRFNEAAKVKKEASELIALLKKDPRAVLEHPDIGIDSIAWAEDILLKEMEKAKMSPEAKRAYDAEQKLKQLEKEKEEAAEQEKHRESLKLQAKHTKLYEEEIQKALEKSGIPKTTESVARMARYMEIALENEVELGAEQAATLVRQDYVGDIVLMLNQLDGESLLGLLGEDVATKITT